MISKIHIKNGGFVALISTVLLATGVLAFSIATLASAVLYSDLVWRREIRIQVGLNLTACLDTAELMISADYFISGAVGIGEFGCTVMISNDFAGHTSAIATAGISGIAEIGKRN